MADFVLFRSMTYVFKRSRVYLSIMPYIPIFLPCYCWKAKKLCKISVWQLFCRTKCLWIMAQWLERVKIVILLQGTFFRPPLVYGRCSDVIPLGVLALIFELQWAYNPYCDVCGCWWWLSLDFDAAPSVTSLSRSSEHKEVGARRWCFLLHSTTS